MKTKLTTITEVIQKSLYINNTAKVFDLNGREIGYYNGIDEHGNVLYNTKNGVSSKGHTNTLFVKVYLA